jgi:Rad3-related DNA helicase
MALPDRTTFPAFPYRPYEIQQEFMEELYKCIETGCIGLFESPTGMEIPVLH